jgi:hypothetical protein
MIDQRTRSEGMTIIRQPKPVVVVDRGILHSWLSHNAIIVYLHILDAEAENELQDLTHSDLYQRVGMPSTYIDEALEDLVAAGYVTDQPEQNSPRNVARLWAPPPPPKPKKPGWVYLIACDGRYKIGRTLYPKQRVRQIRTQIKRPLEIIGMCSVEDMVGAEAELHKQYEHKHVGNEWFALDADDVAAITARW